MDTVTNTRPLLQRSDTDSDFDEDPIAVRKEGLDDEIDIKDTRPLFNTWEPTDRYNIGYIIFYVLGTIILLPWFFFITAEEFWMYKFRALNTNVTLTENGRSELQACFTSYMTIAATVPSTLFLIINPLINHKISLNIRMIGSLLTMLILFIVTTVFVKVNTDSWQNEFFLFTLGIVVVLNIASAILQSAVFGVVGRFPSRYISGAVSGQALGGIMAAVAQIVSLTVGASPMLSALVYFIMADVFIVISILSYMFLASTLFFKYHSKELPRDGSIQYKPVHSLDKSVSPIVRDISYTGILGKIWVHGMSLWYCFVVMFCVYPAVTVLVKSVDEGNKSEWGDVYFVPVVTFLLYSFCDYLGRIISGFLQWPEKESWIIAVISIVRTVFIPLVMMCNAQPRHHLPVVIASDWLYIFIIIAFGLSNGYLANITFISVPKIVAAHEQEVASTMLAAFLGVGIACGSGISLLIVKLL
ncbi:equilibrative nucleoside transporter 1 isoform X1 [Rhodnius prolixus]|uniref:equilibrative nucleoside transporter 1 isoform X1 n=2 Tax=Rhodnius prolixus TaxID=13249 RepID=UPI003D188364